MQDLFVKLRTAKAFSRAENRTAYTFRTAIHLAFDWRRRQRPVALLAEDPAGAEEAPLDRLIQVEELEQILEAMKHLSDLGRHVLVSRYLRHQEYAEIAKELGKSKHHVRWAEERSTATTRNRVKVQEQDVTVWVDARTRLPVRFNAEGKNEEGKPSQLVVGDFKFDREVDAALFSFQPPAGYKLEARGVGAFPPAPAEPRLKDLVVTPLVGIGPARFGMGRAEVERLLGRPDAAEPVGKYGSVNLNYGSRGMFIAVGQKLGVVMITCVAQKVMAVRVRDFSGKTDKGIAVGAHEADITKAYGRPSSRSTNKGSTYLSYGPLKADFTLVGDELVQMTFQRPRAAK